MPQGVVYVGRPTRWGNPWSPANAYVSKIEHGGAVVQSRAATITECVAMYRVDVVERTFGYGTKEVRAELAGKDLACWCPLDKPCHADVLLELANQ